MASSMKDRCSSAPVTLLMRTVSIPRRLITVMGPDVQELLLNPGNTFVLQHQYGDNGVYSVIVTAFNEDDIEQGSDTATVTVYNVAPTIESLTGSSTDPVQLGSPYTINSVFSDPGYLDTHVATINWGDGQTTSIDVPFGISCSCRKPHLCRVPVYTRSP